MKYLIERLAYVFKFIYNLFTKHPNNIGENYLTHMAGAIKLSMLSFLAFIIFFVHSIFPFLFESSGCFIVDCMHDSCKRNLNIDNDDPFFY